MHRRRHKRKEIRLFSVSLVPMLILVHLVFGTAVPYLQHYDQWHEQADAYRELAQAEKEWILSCQTEDGLILPHHWQDDGDGKDQNVIPYFSSIAAIGLLSGTPTHEQILGARSYLLWYFDHLNTDKTDPVNGDGTIYDYQITRKKNGKLIEKSKGSYDSVDSYAAAILVVAEQYMYKGEMGTLMQHAQDLNRIIDALLRTIYPNGLSIAKKEFPVQYLMDNAEVHRGLLAAQALLERIEPSSPRLPRIVDARVELKEAVDELLWDGTYFEIGLSDNGIPFEKYPGDRFYPDSTVQLFPIIFGLLDLDDPRTLTLYEDFSQTWGLAQLAYRDFDPARSYWCAAVYAAAKVRDEPTVLEFLKNYRAALKKEGRRYPLYTGDAGWAALACGEMEHYYRTRIR